MPPKKIENKVTPLKTEVVRLKTPMQTLQIKAKEKHERLIALFFKTSNAANNNGSAMKDSSQFPNGVLYEFQKLVKKVELLMFDGEDSA